MVTGVSRAVAASLVDGGSVEVDGNGRAFRQDAGVRRHDGCASTLPAEDNAGVQPDPSVAVQVVYEDADVVVVDKPPGLVVHPGAGNPTGTLVNGLLARFPEIAEVGDPARPGIVHRLDKGTSGLLVVAATPAAYGVLVDQLAASVRRASVHDARVGASRAGYRRDRRAGRSVGSGSDSHDSEFTRP